MYNVCMYACIHRYIVDDKLCESTENTSSKYTFYITQGSSYLIWRFVLHISLFSFVKGKESVDLNKQNM